MKYDSKRLLILGGAAQCKKAVEAAHDLGAYVIINDIAPNKETSKAADETIKYSLYDFDSLLNWCKENVVDGILNYCVDAAQHTYNFLCTELNKPCFGNKEQFFYLTDKNAFKQLCIDSGLDVIPSYAETTPVEKIDFPVLIKPAESSGSRGASICFNTTEFLSAFEKAKKISLNGHVVIEKYMGDYQDFTVTYIISNGIPYLIRTGDRFLGNFKDGLNRQCICTVCPSGFTNAYLTKINPKVISMLKKLNIKDGPVFMQGFIDGDTVRFYDPGFRFPGGEYERIFRLATNIDVTKSIVDFALGGKIEEYANNLEKSYLLNNYTAVQLYVTIKPGKICKFSGLDALRQNKEVVYISQKAFVGDIIPQSGDIKQRALEIALLVDSGKDIKKSIEQVYNVLSIIDDFGDDMIVSKLDVNKLFKY